MKAIIRRARSILAPSGSRGDRWLRSALQTLNVLRQMSFSAIVAAIARRLLPGFVYRPLADVNHRRKLAKAAPHQEKLIQIIRQNAAVERVLVFPPSLDWNTQLFQRPQQLALALARQGALVFYIQPKIVQAVKDFQPIQERLYLCNVPVETFWVLKNPTIYILTWNRKYVNEFDAPKVIYDYVDEIETFYGNHAQMYKDHERLIRNAELMVATAQRLYDQVHTLRPDALLCPNGVDYELLASARQQERQARPPAPPADMGPILEKGQPIVGYYGALARWFDFELLLSLARLRPDLSFVLVGPDYDNTLRPSRLLECPNVYWLGVKPYEQIPRYLQFFDVATIPFQLNEITHSTSPLKLFEYMAGGKPVVITAMHESMRYPGVLVAHDAADFSRKIDQALALKTDAAYLRQIDQVARENTWDARARQILDAMAKPTVER
jgi:glycosyltransferase involved in cell wall biosynthesis